MAVMSDADRQEATREAIKRLFVESGSTAFTDTDDLKACVDATDQWIDDNASSYVAALPTGEFKSNSTGSQKTILFAYVAFKRAGLI